MPTATQVFRAMITADADGAVKELKKFDGQVDKTSKGVTSKTDRMKSSMSGVAVAAKAVGAAAVIGLGKNAVDAASELEESINAVQVTFGDAADGVLKLSENAAEGVGLASTEFNGLAVAFSGFASDIAGPGGDVAAVIETLTTRAADFASVMDRDVAEIGNVFRSTLSGETEPIKQFGIQMSAAAVNARALELGLAATAAEISSEDKTYARFSLLMEETDKFAGDWANTSDTLAHKQRVLKADLTNLSAELGSHLLPAATSAVGVVGDLVGAFQGMPKPAQDATVALGLAAGAIALVGTTAATAGASVLAFMGAYQTVSAGVKGDDDFLTGDVNALAKPWQALARTTFNFVSEGGLDNLEMIAEFEEANKAAADFDMTLLAGLSTFGDVRAKVEELTGSKHAANQVALEWNKTQRDTAAAAEEVAFQTQNADGALGEYRREAHKKERADVQAARAAEDHAQAVEDLISSVDTAISRMFDYEDANLALIESANDYAESMQDAEISAGELRQEEIALAEEALALAQIFAETEGAVAGSTESYVLQKQELARLADQFPALRDEIALYIAELNRIPGVVGTSIVLSRSTTASGGSTVLTSTGDGIQFGDVRGFDSGGVVPGARGEARLVMAHGGETILPTHKQSMPMGGITIQNLNVQAPAGSDPDEFAARIAEGLKRYTRLNGPLSGVAA